MQDFFAVKVICEAKVSSGSKKIPEELIDSNP